MMFEFDVGSFFSVRRLVIDDWVLDTWCLIVDAWCLLSVACYLMLGARCWIDY